MIFKILSTVAFCIAAQRLCGSSLTPDSIAPVLTISREEMAGKLAEPAADQAFLLRSSFESRRLDLIEECLIGKSWESALWEPIDELPASDFKDKVTLLLLRNDNFDSSEIQFSLTNKRIYPLLSYGPYWAIILKYFPGLPLRDALVYNSESRHILANAIERAMANPDQRDAIQSELDKATQNAPGKNKQAPPPRGVSVLKANLQELARRLGEIDTLNDTPNYDQHERLELLKSKARLNDELKASQWIEDHSKSTAPISKTPRPVSTGPAANLPVNASVKPVRGTFGREDWVFWCILTAVGLVCSILIWWIPKKAAFRKHEI